MYLATLFMATNQTNEFNVGDVVIVTDASYPDRSSINDYYAKYLGMICVVRKLYDGKVRGALIGVEIIESGEQIDFLHWRATLVMRNSDANFVYGDIVSINRIGE